jgi:hypothetical protein
MAPTVTLALNEEYVVDEQSVSLAANDEVSEAPGLQLAVTRLL